MSNDRTIYAPSTAPGKSGVAVMRVSGSLALQVATTISQKTITPRHAVLAKLHNAAGAIIDHALVFTFQNPASFTGEDVAEFHVHGSRAVIKALAERLAELGCVLAEPGEFTRRAFLNGKLDLAEAEGLADLINAETEAQRKQAVRQMGGELSKLYEDWRHRLLRALAHMEADIDFPEDDLPPEITAARIRDLSQLTTEIDHHLHDNRRGERLRDGYHIAILGAPNAGKSSLLNALAARDAAIVSPQAGTTRDIVEVHLDLGGYAVVLSDTAGLRDTADDIEAEGIRRAHARAAEADLKIALFDVTAAPDRATENLLDENTIVVFTKSDLAKGEKPPSGFLLSTRTGQGVTEFLSGLTQRIASDLETRDAAPPLTRQRHREALQQAKMQLECALKGFEKNLPPELIAEDVRLATRALGRIIGRVDVEDLLDVIFRDFCIGK